MDGFKGSSTDPTKPVINTDHICELIVLFTRKVDNYQELLLMQDSKTEQIFGYKALYQEAYIFLRAISEENLELANSININNLDCLDLYSKIIILLQQKHQLQKLFNVRNAECSQLKQKLILLEKSQIQRSDITDQRVRIKLQLFLRLQMNDLKKAQCLAWKNKLFEISEVIQQLEEYRWLINMVAVRKRKKYAFQQQTEAEIEFSSKRKEFQSQINEYFSKSDHCSRVMQQKLNQVLGNKFKDGSFLSSEANALFKRISCQLRSYKYIVTLFKKKQSALREKLEKIQTLYLYGNHYNDQFDQIFTIIENYLNFVRTELQSMHIRKQVRKSLKEQKMSQLSLQLTKSKKSQGKKQVKLAQKDLKEIEQQLVKINSLLFDFKQPNEVLPNDTNYKEIIISTYTVLERLSKQKNIDKDTIAIMVKLVLDFVEKIKRITERMHQKTSISQLAELALENDPSKVFRMFQKNINLLIQKYSQKLKPQNRTQQLNVVSLEESYQLSLMRKDKSQLVKLIGQLREESKNVQQILKEQLQNQREMQSKFIEAQKEMKKTRILIPILQRQSSQDNSRDSTFDAALQMAKLKYQAQQRQKEIKELKSAMVVRVQEQRRKCEQYYQKELMKYKKKYEQSKKDFNQVVDSMNQLLEQKRYELQCRESQELSKHSKELEIDSLRQQIQYYQSENYKLVCFNELKERDQEVMLQVKEIGVGSSFLDTKQQAEEQVPLGNRNSLRLQKTESYTLDNNFCLKSGLQETFPSREISDYRTQRLQLAHEKEDLSRKNQVLLMQVSRHQKTILTYKFEIQMQKKQMQIKIQELNRKIKEFQAKFEEQKLNQHLFKPQNLQRNHLFAIGMIFDENSLEERQYLINTLVSYLGPIRKTQLLYRFDSFNKANPHKYIDKHSNIVVVLKTIYGKYVAAYSREMIDSAGTKVGFGLLMGLWNQRTFEILPNKKPVTYDDYFIIFGNSELRLKSQETKVFSNFGINNAYFNSEGCKVDAFLGEGTLRQLNFQSYEIFTLDLQRSW